MRKYAIGSHLWICIGLVYALTAGTWATESNETAQYDLIIRQGHIYDGSGQAPFVGDIAISDDKIAAIGDLQNASGKQEIDARGLAISPGFINMLSWASSTLIIDGRTMSDIHQGVTLEVMGEGNSMGPLNDTMKKDMIAKQGDIKYPIEWTTLGQYLEYLVRRGVSVNVASFVGNATVRMHAMGIEDRRPTPTELNRMRDLVRQAMEEGAVGLSSALIYVPSCYADKNELVALAKVVSEYDGMYISHLRSESSRLLEATDELIDTAREANVRAEIYHVKAAGQANFHKLDALAKKIEAARAEGLHITADMYTYAAAATGLTATMPPWVHEGGTEARAKRLKDPATRRRIRREMLTPTEAWDNMYVAVGSPDNLLLTGFRTEALKPLTGKTLAQVAAMRGQEPEYTAMDLIVEDNSRVNVVLFLMSEENVRKKIALPWVSFCSDASAPAAEEIFLKSNPHPRTYGSFARVLSKYVRQEKALSLPEAIRRLTSFPAENLKLDRRGSLKPGYFADIVVFDPDTIQDHATFEKPHQYATGVVHVLVNGTQVIQNGQHTGAKPGQVVRGPGWPGR